MKAVEDQKAHHGLNQELLFSIKEVFLLCSELDQVFLYGSRALGIHQNYSDVDLCLLGESLTIDHQFKIIQVLEDLKTSLIFDVILFHCIDNPALTKHIEQYGICLYNKRNHLYTPLFRDEFS